MRNLLEFLARFGSFFLFLILEAICFFIIFRFNDDKNRIFLTSTNAIAGYTLQQYDAIADYLSIPQQLAQLQEENSRLRAQLPESLYNEGFEQDTASLTVRKQDSVYTNTFTLDSIAKSDTLIAQVYTYIPANVISNSINRRNNTITINKGQNQQIAPRMGVLGPQGIVGIVRYVSPRFSSIISLLHADISISASIKNKGYFGALVWENPDPRYMKLEAIPKHAVINPGDSVITSGFSSAFPAGIFIGTVVKVSQDAGDNFHNIKVKLANDLSNVNHVYVVQNKWLEEINLMQKPDGKQ
jgi:rod shape-determining protein MreC